LELALAAVRYERSAVSLHRELKFGEAIELTGPIATRMAIVWRHRGPFRPDLLVPIPPDPLRIGPRRRTPWRLARAVSRELGAPCRRALRKPRSTRAQTGRSASTRRTALGGAFSADLRLVAGRRVVLIDDVCTTGGTLEAAAAALRDAGAERIAALVWARTPLPADRRGRFRDLGRDGREPAATI
jgi:predicted amidophosphoribosyltransferase